MCDFVAWCHLQPEAQAAWVQAVFSVLGIFTAIWIAYRQSRDARSIAAASVRPKLSFAMRTPAGRAELTLENNGLGPAIIRSARLFLDGIEQTDASYDSIGAVLGNLDVPIKNAQGATLGAGQSIRAGAAETVFDFDIIQSLGLSFAKVRTELLRVQIAVKYVSLYDEEFDVTTGLPGAKN